MASKPPGRPIGARGSFRFNIGDVAELAGLTRGSARAALRREGVKLDDGAAGLRAVLGFLGPRMGWPPPSRAEDIADAE